MNRGAIVAIAAGVGGITALLLFVGAPSTGPELDAGGPVVVAPVTVPRVPATPVVPASPAPTRREAPVGQPTGGLKEVGPRRLGGLKAGPWRGRGGAVLATMRDRYTKRGQERLLARVERYAKDAGWDDATYEEVTQILDDYQQQGVEAIAAAREGEGVRSGLGRELQALRSAELDELGEVLGDEATAFAARAGLVRQPVPDRGALQERLAAQQPKEE